MLLLGFLNFTTASSIKSFLLAVHIRGEPSVSSLALPVETDLTSSAGCFLHHHHI